VPNILFMVLDSKGTTKWVLFENVTDGALAARQLALDGLTPLEFIVTAGETDEELEVKAREVQDKFFAGLRKAAEPPDYGF
jgi:hypothetical protein